MLSPAKLTQKLADWEKKREKINKIEAERDAQLLTLIETFERKSEPITAAADQKLEPLYAELTGLEAEIGQELLGRIGADGSIPLPQIETDKAIATVLTDRKRQIDAASFLRNVPPRLRHTKEFAECLTVLVGKAEKFLDARTLARVVSVKLSPSILIKLK